MSTNTAVEAPEDTTVTGLVSLCSTSSGHNTSRERVSESESEIDR